MMDFLHHYHHGEDTGLWPLLRERNPPAGPLLDRMEAGHARIALAVELLCQAAGRYATNGKELHRGQLGRRAVRPRRAALATLRGQEDDAMPLVSATLTDAEWRAWTSSTTSAASPEPAGSRRPLAIAKTANSIAARSPVSWQCTIQSARPGGSCGVAGARAVRIMQL